MKKPRPVGRPTKYDPAFCDRVVKIGAEGYSKAEIAADLGVTRETVNDWIKAHAEFSDAISRAHDLSLAWWEKQGRTNLSTGGFQGPLWKQCMSGRFPAEPYRERVEHTGPEGGPIRQSVDLTGLSPDQLRALASIKLPADA